MGARFVAISLFQVRPPALIRRGVGTDGETEWDFRARCESLERRLIDVGMKRCVKSIDEITQANDEAKIDALPLAKVRLQLAVECVVDDDA